jgi:multicomponent Na+:H+ antiporter subunit C
VLAYILCLVLMAIGIYAMVAKKNVVKIIIGMMVTEYAINMLLVVVGWRTGGVPPILPEGMPAQMTPDGLSASPEFLARTVDPLAQALIMTSIMVSLAVLLLSVALAIRIYQKYQTFDITEIRKLKG